MIVIFGIHNNGQMTPLAICETEAQQQVIVRSFLEHQSWQDVIFLAMDSSIALNAALEFTSKYYQQHPDNKPATANDLVDLLSGNIALSKLEKEI